MIDHCCCLSNLITIIYANIKMNYMKDIKIIKKNDKDIPWFANLNPVYTD